MKAFIFIALIAATPAFAASTDAGKYQAVLGDCAGCHGKNLAGGVALQTPFGKLVTPNITPDRDTGIGDWSADDFRQAMKAGVGKGGKRLYPAMPYPAYSHMPDADVAALWAWLRTVKPVRNQVDVNQLHFPFNLRFLLGGWNMLFFKPAPYVHDAAKSVAWNRGAYLVTGPAHCGDCHSPRNLFGADKGGLAGASLQGWWAPDLTGDGRAGLGAWSTADIAQYLQTGRNTHSLASGPMAEAVENSTSQMTDGDLNAIAVYLKDLAPGPGNGGSGGGQQAQMQAGERIYQVSCSACHGANGKGSVLFPPLAGNPIVLQRSPETLARVVLAGGKGASTAKAPTGPAMPSFAWRWNDEQVAAVLTYIRNNWGNEAPAVSGEGVSRIRTNLHGGS
jgi:mono/diheme cytochrome c family protein